MGVHRAVGKHISYIEIIGDMCFGDIYVVISRVYRLLIVVPVIKNDVCRKSRFFQPVRYGVRYSYPRSVFIVAYHGKGKFFSVMRPLSSAESKSVRFKKQVSFGRRINILFYIFILKFAPVEIERLPDTVSERIENIGGYFFAVESKAYRRRNAA